MKQADRLRGLAPSLYAAREPADQPLSRFFDVLGGALDELQAAITRLLDDHFPERAHAEALPRLAELLGARLLTLDPGIQRAVITRTVGWRRRKGALGTLEEVLALSTRWGVEVDEAFRSIRHTQDLRHLLPWRGRTAIVWDPIAIADPLTRRAPGVTRPRDAEPAFVAPLPGESVDATLRRLGRPDAGRYAASPRTLDLLGWTRPEVVVVRSDRLVPVELEGVRPGSVQQLPLGPTGVRVNPQDMDGPLTWLAPTERPDLIDTRTDVHEPDPRVATDRPVLDRPSLLTPTALAADGDAAEAAGALRVRVDGVTLVGASDPADPTPLPMGDPGARPILRFAEPTRPGPGDAWRLELLADVARARIVVSTSWPGASAEQIAVQLNLPLQTRLATVPGVLALQTEAEGGLSRVLLDFERDSDLALVEGQVRAAALAVPRPAGAEAPTTTFVEAQSERRAVLQVDASRGAAGPLVATDAAVQAGAVTTLRLTRLAGPGFRRAGVDTLADPGLADTAWTAVTVEGALGIPRSASAGFEIGGDPFAIRVVSVAGALRVARLALADPTPTWADLGAPATLPPDGPGFSALVEGNALYLVGPDGAGGDSDDERMGVWRIAGIDGAGPIADADVSRLDLPGTRPPARNRPALAWHGGRLYVFGGEIDGVARTDLWSVDPAAPGPWQDDCARSAPARVGATLLSAPDGLLLIGGESGGDVLDPAVLHCDPTRARPVWRARRPLPLVEGPGQLVAWLDAGTLNVLAWDDHAAPRALRLQGGVWLAGPRERAPNPPLLDELVRIGDAWFSVGAAPLPRSEIVFCLDGAGHLAHLPDLPLAPGESASFLVTRDGSTWRERAPGEPGALHDRAEGALHRDNQARQAPARRYGVPGRLAWQPFVLRQRSLGDWQTAVPPVDPGVVGLDPRLGRVIAHPAAGVPTDPERISVSFFSARGAAIGAGLLQARPEPRRIWLPRGARIPAFEPGAPTAWIDPPRAGQTRGGAPVVADVATALQLNADVAHPVLGIIGSPRLPVTRVHQAIPAGLTIRAADFGATPVVDRAVDGSMVLHPRFDVGLAGTTRLAGLWLLGRLELVMVRDPRQPGRPLVDVRWCTLGLPDPTAHPDAVDPIGLRVAGAGHQGVLLRRTIPTEEVVLRLVGCQLGAIDLPPWVALEAYGCTIDAGSDYEAAIRAAGASIRLRNCTIRGRTEAGALFASECVFGGSVQVDRPDIGHLRYSLLPPGGRTPALHRCRPHHVSFGSHHPADPRYLVLAENNGPLALAAGDHERSPGAFAERGEARRALHLRCDDHLPLGLVPHHFDRVAQASARMNRSPS